MKLSDKEIELWIKNKKIKILPNPKKKYINGSSIDIKLGNEFRKFKKNIKLIDLKKKNKNILKKKIKLKKEQFIVVQNNEFILAKTKEYIILPNNIVGYIDGISSLARLGLMIHSTSSKIDPGWEGKLVLEIYNLNKIPIKLTPNIKIANISFELLSKPSYRPYNKRKNSKYKKQKSIKI